MSPKHLSRNFKYKFSLLTRVQMQRQILKSRGPAIDVQGSLFALPKLEKKYKTKALDCS